MIFTKGLDDIDDRAFANALRCACFKLGKTPDGKLLFEPRIGGEADWFQSQEEYEEFKQEYMDTEPERLQRFMEAAERIVLGKKKD